MFKNIILKNLKFVLTVLTKIKFEFVISTYLTYLIKKNNKNIFKSKSNLLVFEKPRFNIDIDALSKYTETTCLILPINISVLLGKIFLPEEIRGQHKYHKLTSDRNQKLKLEYRLFLKKILPNIFQQLNIDGIIVGNMDYWEHQEWSWVGQEIGVPTIVLYRESVGWEERNKRLQKHYSNLDYTLPISKLVVFGPETKAWMDQTDVTAKENIVFTGAPRTDFYYHADENTNSLDKNLIVLFDFISEKYSSSTTPIEVLKEFVKLSNENPDFEYLIKTKEDIYKSVLLEKIASLNLSTENILIDSDYKFTDVLKNAKIIIGYMRSTVMLESMIASAHIILPVWGDLVDEDTEISIKEDKLGEIYKISDKNLFLETINNILLTESFPLRTEIKEIRQKYIYKNLYRIDGRSSERFSDVIKNLLAR